jgi:2-C-methyl-D-erythritol 4-phosphate cytidylyltransferase
MNKVYLKLNNKYIYKYSIDKFLSNNYIDEIIVVMKQNEENLFNMLEYDDAEKIKTVVGGKTRQESVYNALVIATGDIVIIGDGARPFLKSSFINMLIEEMDKFNAVTLGVKEKNTLKSTNESQIVEKTIDRSNVWEIQTPQCFKKDLLIKGHIKAKEKNMDITDDCKAMELIGEKVKIIEGSYFNIKITTNEDWILAKAICENVEL